MKTDRSSLVVRTVLIAAAGLVAVALSACNTVEGAGKDLQESSQNVKEAISD
jgi:predicted small secreted protein